MTKHDTIYLFGGRLLLLTGLVINDRLEKIVLNFSEVGMSEDDAKTIAEILSKYVMTAFAEGRPYREHEICEIADLYIVSPFIGEIT